MKIWAHGIKFSFICITVKFVINNRFVQCLNLNLFFFRIKTFYEKINAPAETQFKNRPV